MRTTLTLDDDIAAKLKARSAAARSSFKAVVNEMLRLGLAAAEQRDEQPPFVVEARVLGLREGLSYDNVAELLDAIEQP